MRHTTLRCILLTLFLPATAFAQSAVSGRVTDPQGAAVAAATLTLTGAGISPQTTQSGADGSFSVPNVAPGSYVLAVDAAGFQHWTQSITVGSSANAPVNVVLPIPGFSESVAVSAPRLEEELPQQLQQSASASRRSPAPRSRTAVTTMSARRCRRSYQGSSSARRPAPSTT